MATATTTMTEPAKASQQLTIKQIYTYPIKSLRGIPVPTLTATPLGLAHDRHFMLVSLTPDPSTSLPHTNMHVSQFEEMCLFTCHLPTSASSADDDSTPPTHIQVHYPLTHAFRSTTTSSSPHPFDPTAHLTVPLRPDTTGLERVAVRMHHSPTKGYDMGTEYNEWFSARFGYEVKLLYLGDQRRKVLGNVAPGVAARQARGEMGRFEGLKNKADEDLVAEGGQAGGGWLSGVVGSVMRLVGGGGGAADAGLDTGKDEDGVDQGIGFADVAPFLFVSTASWKDASARLGDGKEMDVTKFRPNFVVEGAEEAWDEDFWGDLNIEGSQGDAVKIVLTQNCARCNSLNVDYETGKVATGPEGSILKKLMKDRRVDPGSKWSPIFGRYGFLGGRGKVTVSVGDRVTVTKRNEERTKWEWPGLGTYPKQT